MKVLQEKKLIRKDHSFYTMVTPTDKTFKKRYIYVHKEILPGLDDAYTAACKGKLPTEVAL
jgi:mTERF domain-containing protein